MKCLHALTIAAAVAVAMPVAATQSPAAAKAAASKQSVKRSVSRTVPKSQAQESQQKGLALATATIEALSDVQVEQAHIEIASRVMLGRADCEFNQNVNVEPIDGKPAHFRVHFKGLQYTMVPQETTTGAVRLEDKKAGMMWLQIPAKSMLMNSKIGQRLVDSCTMVAQRTPVETDLDFVSAELRATLGRY